MTPTPTPQTPARVRQRWRWGRIVLLGLVAGIGALGWNQYTWHRAVRQLEEAGITVRKEFTGMREPSVGERLRDAAARNDWKRFLVADTWKVSPPEWRTWDPSKAAALRNLDALAPAFRRISSEMLILSDCPALENVNGLAGITSLRYLRLGKCPALRNMAGIKDLIQLETFGAYRCPALGNADCLKSLTALVELDLDDCPGLTDADQIKGFASLRRLELRNCTSLTNVDGLSGVNSLRWLNLDGCSALKSVKSLNGLSGLEWVFLRGCTNLHPDEVAALKAALPNARIVYP